MASLSNPFCPEIRNPQYANQYCTSNHNHPRNPSPCRNQTMSSSIQIKHPHLKQTDRTENTSNDRVEGIERSRQKFMQSCSGRNISFPATGNAPDILASTCNLGKYE
ncbi:hypothetical protein NC652_021886 [Populus alba x Populus x berolinensis]|nr:hypothetical protein NC652_021886 [Populus alba x Populus x berolinensis]